ncbi:MAG: LysE family transporter [Campylobacteraceae bacterium]|jgi:homoserine/homoserine lactone efflux protein|nr:LysE family transporter [Campylobacteraceae bacterium]
MEFHIWLTMLIASIIISVSPGAGAIATMDSGLNYGFKRSYATIFGLQIGLLAQILIVAVGLGGILATSETLYEIIKWIGVIYLVYLGVMKFRDSNSVFKNSKTKRDFNFKRSFLQATLINLTNPKATVFLIAFMPQFLDINRPKLTQITIICLTLLVVDIFVMSGYSSLAQVMKRWINNPKIVRTQNQITGVLLIIVAFFLAQNATQK